MVMGVLVVLVVGGLAYRYFQNKNNLLEKEGQEQAESTQEEGFGTVELPTTHTIAENEHLWMISERYFRSGYNWVDIAKENNLENPNLLSVGQELRIPDVEAKQLTISQLPETGIYGSAIEGNRYTSKEADSLSKIAHRAYGDVFMWPRIWGANRDKINNPNLILPDQELIIPR